MESECAIVPTKTLMKHLECGICKKIFKYPVRLIECGHLFCNKCIIQELEEKHLTKCPICNLSCMPLSEKIRPDHNMHSIRNTVVKALKDSIKANENDQKRCDEEPESSSPPLPTKGKEKPASFSGTHIITEPTALKVTPRGSGICIHELHQDEQRLSAVESCMPQYKDAHAVNLKESLDCATKQASNSGPNDGVEAESVNAMRNPAQSASRKQRGCPRKITAADKEFISLPQSPGEASSGECQTSFKPMFFEIKASNRQEGYPPLPHLQRPFYIRIEDIDDQRVSSIQKLVARDLKLESEDEVEISMLGHAVSPDMKLCYLPDIYVNSTTIGASAKDLVLSLTYGRRADN